MFCQSDILQAYISLNNIMHLYSVNNDLIHHFFITPLAEPTEYRFRLCVFFVRQKSANCFIISKILPNARLVRDMSNV